MKISEFWLRALGISGIFGGLVLFSGDLLFYYASDSVDINRNMGNASDIRIMISGLLALIASWLYLLGLGQVYFAFKPAKAIARNIVILSFGGILIGYGVIHGAYVAIATSAKLAVQNNLDMETATALASNTNNLIRLLIYPVFALLSLVFIFQVWKKKTYYPRWMIIFFPLTPFLFQGLFCKYLSGKIWLIVCGGYFNLILVVFFTASTIALWHVKKNHHVGR